MKAILAAVIGISWSASYILIIRRGFADRSYGMPIVAAGCNVSWEFIFTFIHPLPWPQPIISGIWFILDVGIVATIVWYGPAEFSRIPRRIFYPGLAGIIIAAYLATLLVADDLDMARASLAAFASNLLMSGLFLSMLQSRWTSRALGKDPLRGQSLSIAWTKLNGSACAALATYLYVFKPYSTSLLLPFLFVTVFVVDLAYIISLYVARRVLSVTAVAADLAISAVED